MNRISAITFGMDSSVYSIIKIIDQRCQEKTELTTLA